MHKQLIKNCQYAKNPITGNPLFCNVYVLVDDNFNMLWHENLFLSELSKSASENTARSYASDLLSFTKATSSLGGWKSITQSQMNGYIHGELFQSRGYAFATMTRHIETLKRFFDWLESKGYLEYTSIFDWSFKHLYISNPTDNSAHLSTQHTFHELYIDSQTYNKLLAGVDSKNSFIRARDLLVLNLGYKCGTRSCEINNLDSVEIRKAINNSKNKNKDLWATTKINLIGKGAKSRELLLPPELCESIMDYLRRWRFKINSGKGPLICTQKGKHLKSSKHASTVFSKACLNSKIPRYHHQGYHRLRKSFGTNLVDEYYEKGGNPWVEVPRRLGHKNIDTTILYIQFDALRNQRSEILTELSMMNSRFSGIQQRGCKY